MRASSWHRAKRWKFFVDGPRFLAFGLLAALLSAFASMPAQKSSETEKKVKDQAMRWAPPDVDATPKPLSATPPCILSEVLGQAGNRAREMEDNLPSFTADETIQYESLAQIGGLPEYGLGRFAYVVLATKTPSGPVIRETRTPVRGTPHFSAGEWNRGLAEMALIFLPKLQRDYDMKCDGQTKWNDEAAWAVHFRQRSGVSGHTFSYEDGYGGVYVARLKGRAWVSAISGEVVHMETALLEGIPEVHVRNSWFSIDYAPVQFRRFDVRLWLPQRVKAYTQFDDHRTITYHVFENFMLFSVETKQEIKKPAEPR